MPARARRRAAPRRALALAAVLFLVPAFAGCGANPPGPVEGAPLAGTGDAVAELRKLDPFTRVSVGAGLRVTIGEAAEQQVTVSAQGNLLPVIETEVVDGQLIVTIAPPGVTATEPMTLSLRMTRVESVALSGGAVGFVEHTGDALNLDVSGGATLTAIGDTTSLRLTASSGSHAKLGELRAQVGQITVNDGSSVELTVVTRLAGTADGGATVMLTSPPAEVAVETTSGATVQGGG
jgi:hypothetical protein